MGKMAVAHQRSILEQNSQLPTPYNFGLQFSECQQKWKMVSAIMKNVKMAIAPQRSILEQNSQLPTP